MNSRFRPVLFLLLAVGLLVGGQWLRAAAGIEFAADSVRAWVEQQGWMGPVLFIGLVAGRQFILLPSALLLSAGGLVFGGVLGTLFGAIGLVGSAVTTFGLARGLGGEKVKAQVAARFPLLDRYIESAGPLLVFLTIAYPAGPMTAVFWAAGFSSVRLASLLVAVSLGGLIRSAAYSFFGAALTDVGSPAFWIASVGLGLALVVPMAHPGLRRRLFRPEARPTA